MPSSRALGDFAITELSGIIDWLEKDDLVLADRGFDIQSLLSAIQAGVIVGHTHQKAENGRDYYTNDQLYPNLRIHVERAMMLIKRMGFLKKTIRSDQKHLISRIFQISSYMIHYGMPLLNNEDSDRIYSVEELDFTNDDNEQFEMCPN